MTDKIKDGGSAYPRPFGFESGMSIRDWFAGMALQGICSNQAYLRNISPEGKAEDHVAIAVYEIADAMLRERSKGQTE